LLRAGDQDHHVLALGQAKDNAANDLFWPLITFLGCLFQGMDRARMLEEAIGNIHVIESQGNRRGWDRHKK
jgi:hypothetical protein